MEKKREKICRCTGRQTEILFAGRNGPGGRSASRVSMLQSAPTSPSPRPAFSCGGRASHVIPSSD